MDFSEDWKSIYPSSFVFGAPSLLSSSKENSSLGPLFFHPLPENLKPTVLLSSLNLFSQPLPACAPLSTLVPNLPATASLISSIMSESFPIESTRVVQQSCLHMLHRRNGDIILFFPSGLNADCISCVVLSSPNETLKMNDKYSNIFALNPRLSHQIHKISVSAAASSSWDLGDPLTEGFLVACTLYSVYWFRVEAKVSSDGLGAPILVQLGVAEFKNCVVHACWSQHRPKGSAVLLETGELHLFDLSSRCNPLRLPTKLRGTKVKIPLSNAVNFGLEKPNIKWLSCEFGWHSQILVVARTDVVFLVDLRSKESQLTVLATIETCGSFRQLLGETDCFLSFCKAKYDDFCFSVATKFHLLLFDMRKPLMPLLHWFHNQNAPSNIQMFKLSELRPLSMNSGFNRASESGFAILLSSFWNSESSIFSYGPSLCSLDSFVASNTNKLSNTAYAWGLPSKLSLLGHQCHCPEKQAPERFMAPGGNGWQQKKERVLGFCILSNNSLDCTDELNDGLGGFTLIRLTSSGRLELQMYQASWNCGGTNSDCRIDSLACYSSSLSRCLADNILPDFVHLKLDYLLGYLNDHLADVFESKMQSAESYLKGMFYDRAAIIFDGPISTPFTQGGLNMAMSDILDQISFPTSFHEISCRKIWTGLSSELQQFGFARYPDVGGEVQKNLSISKFPIHSANMELQSPSTNRTTPSEREFLTISGKKYITFGVEKSGESSHGGLGNNQNLLGSLLPLPLLSTLQDYAQKIGSSNFRDKVTGLCHDVANICEDNLQKGSFSMFNEGDASQLLQEGELFFIHRPVLNIVSDEFAEKTKHVDKRQTLSFEDKKFSTMVSQKRKKISVADPQKRHKLFDDLAPITLTFDASNNDDFTPKELEVYRSLTRQFSKWQQRFKPYKDFCASANIS